MPGAEGGRRLNAGSLLRWDRSIHVAFLFDAACFQPDRQNGQHETQQDCGGDKPRPFVFLSGGKRIRFFHGNPACHKPDLTKRFQFQAGTALKLET